MKKLIAAILVMTFGTLSLTACTKTDSKDTTALEKHPSPKSSGLSADPDLTDPEGNDSTPDSDNPYGYPESIYSTDAPYSWYVYNGDYHVDVPAVFEESYKNPGPYSTRYRIYTVSEDLDVYFYAMSDSWLDEAPEWMDTDTLNKTLEEVPDYMEYCFTNSVENYADVNHISPFKPGYVDYTIYDESIVTIDGHDFIRQEVEAYGHALGTENTLYYTIYYGILEVQIGDKLHEMPYFVYAMSLNGSDEARQIMNDAVDYAMTHSVE